MLINRPPATLPSSAPWSAFLFLGTGGACAVAPAGATMAYWAVTAGHVAPQPGGAFPRVFNAYNNSSYMGDKSPSTYDFALLRLQTPTTNFIPLATSPPAVGEAVYLMGKGYYGSGDLSSAPLALTTPLVQTEAMASNVCKFTIGVNVVTDLSNTDGDFSLADRDSGSPLFVHRNGQYQHCGVAVSGGGGTIGRSSYFMRTDTAAPMFTLFRHRVTGDWNDDGVVDISDFNILIARPDYALWQWNMMVGSWCDGGGQPMSQSEIVARRSLAMSQARVVGDFSPSELSG